MKPIVGIIPSYTHENGSYRFYVSENNIKAISDLGGLPLILPYTQVHSQIDRYLDLINGLYFTGGCDILPEYYGEIALPGLRQLCPVRDEFEIKIYQSAASRDLPMLGVCRGMQIMNVAAGGSLYQDIYSQLSQAGNHDPHNFPRSLPFHSINIDQTSKLYALLGKDIVKVNSRHHEAVKTPAPGYQISGIALDQVIEAIESTNLTFSLAVQWHPEDMYKDYPIFAKLYQGFIDAALAYRQSK